MKALSYKLLAVTVWLIAYCLPLTAQTSGYVLNVEIGSTKILTWKVQGDYTGYDSLYFAVKACTTSSACGRLVGPSKSCSVTYSNPYSTVVCTLYAANTAGFNSAKYFWSIYAYGADTVAVRSGVLNLTLNGQTAVDGIATNYPVHILAIDSSDQEPGVLIGRNSNNATDWWSLGTLADSLNLDTNDVNANFDSLYGYWVNKHEAQTITGQKNFTGEVHFPDSSARHITFYDAIDSMYGGFAFTTGRFWNNADGQPDVVMRWGYNISSGALNPPITVDTLIAEAADEWESHYISGGQKGFERHIMFSDTAGTVRRPLSLFLNKFTGAINRTDAYSQYIVTDISGNSVSETYNNGSTSVTYCSVPTNIVFPSNTTGIAYRRADSLAIIYAPYFNASNEWEWANAINWYSPTGLLSLREGNILFSNLYGIKSTDADGDTNTILYYDQDKVKLIAKDGDPVHLAAQDVFIEDTSGFLYNIKRPFFPSDTSGLSANERYVDINTGNVKQKIPANLVLNGDFSSWTWTAGSSIHPTNWTKQTAGDTAATYLQNSSNRMRIVSDGSARILYNYTTSNATSGVTYGYSFYVASASGDSCYFSLGGVPVKITKTGWNYGEITATTNTYLCAVDNFLSSCDVIIDNLRVWEKEGGSFQAIYEVKNSPLTILNPTTDDTLFLGRKETGAIYDSIAVFDIQDSIAIQVYYDDGSVNNLITTPDTLTTDTTIAFDTTNIPDGSKVYLYFIYLGDSEAYLRSQIYWRE